MKTPPPLTAALPWFPGFYESSLDSLIDREIEMEMEGNGPDRPGCTWEEADARANYAAARQAICRGWCEAFTSETGLSVEMESLESPREYNFTTDRIFVTLPPESVAALKGVRESQDFRNVVEKWFTSRSGFISFYPSDPDSGVWLKPVEEWDHNQLSALIAGWLVSEGYDRSGLEYTLLDYSCVYEAAQHVWDREPVTV